MSRWLPEAWRPPLLVGVDSRAVAWHAADQGLHECPHDALAQALPPRRRRVTLVAGAGLAVHWMQPVPRALASLGELRQVASARCAHLFGGAADDWRVAGDWRLDRPFVCAALPRSDAARLEAPWRGRVRWHTAWLLAGRQLASRFTPDGWNALRSPGWLQLWECRGGHVTALAPLPLAPDHAAGAVADAALVHIRLEQARSESPRAQSLHWLDLCGPAPRNEGIVAVGDEPACEAGASEAHAALSLALQARCAA